jgi:adenosylmethionine-8-amino-7-oxononanoate aminotransferase
MTASGDGMDRGCVWHPYTKHSALEAGPLPVIVRGEGPYLFDREGRRYVDAIASWWACSLGHGHPRVTEAIRAQASRLGHSILGNLTHPHAIELAGRLAALFPGTGRRVMFASDGASAVEAALKIALQYWHNVGRPEKCRFASLREGYHGDTLGSVSVGYVEQFHRPFAAVLPKVYRAESPCCGTCAYGLAPATCAVECFRSMERILEEHAGELAAVIVEPLCQGAAGMRIYAPAYLDRLARRCRERDVLLIADEIATGFGRTGRWFACEHAGVDPDIVCLGKGLSAGYLPISATVVKEPLYETFGDRPADRTFYHGHTFAGNPIAAAAAVETLRVYEEEGIVARAQELGKFLQKRMEQLVSLPAVLNVRGLGMIGAAELKPAAGRPERIRRSLLEAGYLMRPLGDVFYVMPPLTVPQELLEETVAALYTAIERDGGCTG